MGILDVLNEVIQPHGNRKRLSFILDFTDDRLADVLQVLSIAIE